MRTANAPVVIRFGAFGDMILLLPLLRQLAARHGRPAAVVSSGAWSKPLMESQSCVGEVRILASRRRPYWLDGSQHRFVSWLRARPAGTRVYLCEGDPKSLWLVRRAGVPEDRLHWAGHHPALPGEHWIERWMRLDALWNGEPPPAPDALPARLHGQWLELPPGADRDCEHWLGERGWAGRPLVLVQPGSKRTMRRGAVDRASNLKFWPTERWAALVKQILARLPEAQVIVCGSPQELEYTQGIAAASGDTRVASAADQLPIPRLLALLGRAHSLVSVDTGPAHAAAAIGCPLAVLFGVNDPGLWRPYAVSAPVEIVQARHPGAATPTIGAISADEAFAAWLRAVETDRSTREPTNRG